MNGWQIAALIVAGLLLSAAASLAVIGAVVKRKARTPQRPEPEGRPSELIFRASERTELAS